MSVEVKCGQVFTFIEISILTISILTLTSRTKNIYSLQCDLNNVRVQVQATVVGFLASIAAVIFSWIPEGHFRLGHAVLLCASSVATAFIASLLLGRCH